MKAYFDANIYVSYLLGEKNCELIQSIFNLGASCKFSIVLSKTALKEIENATKGSGSMLFQVHIGTFRRMGKLDVILAAEEDRAKAEQINKSLGARLGENDILHCMLAKKYADVFVTSDRALLTYASQRMASFTPEHFLSRLQA
jgi:predicted nucleic acid-binding protein